MKKMTEFEKIKREVKIELGIIPPDPLKYRVYKWFIPKYKSFHITRYYLWVIMSIFLTNYFSKKDRHSLFLDFKAAFVLTLAMFGIIKLKN